MLLVFLVGFILVGSLLLGAIVYFRNRRNKLNIYFAVMAGANACWAFVNLMSAFDKDAIWVRLQYTLGAILLGAGLVWFFYLIERKTNVFRTISIYAVSFFFAIASLYGNLIIKRVDVINFGSFEGEFGPLFFLYTAFIGLALLFIVIRLFVETYRSIGVRKLQLLYVSFGSMVFAALAIVPSFLLPLLGFNSFSALDLIGSFIYISFITYSIVRYRLMNIKAVVARSVLYFLLVSIVSATFIFTTKLATETYAVSKDVNNFITFLVAFVIVVTLDPLKKWLSKHTDNIFYKGKIDYDKLINDLSSIIGRELDLDVMLNQIRQELLDRLKLKHVDVAMRLEGRCKMLKGSGFSDFGMDESLSNFIRQSKDIIVLDEYRRKVSDMPDSVARAQGDKIIASIEKFNWQMIVPITDEKEMAGFLALDDKLSGDVYSKEDINFLSLLTKQISVAIEKARLYEQVQQFNRELQDKVDRATGDLKRQAIDLAERNKFLTTTQSVSNLISRTLDINKIIQIIADSISTELGYVGGLLSFKDEKGEYLYPAAITRSALATKALAALPKPASEYKSSIINQDNYGTRCFTTGSAIASDKLRDFLSPPIPAEAADKIQQITKTVTVVAIPIYSENEIIGTVTYLVAVPEKQIKQIDYEMMNNLADQVGIVYRNVKLYSKLENANAELQQANKDLKQLDQAKSEFLSIASHQLRTPTSAIKGYLSMLLEGDFGAIPKNQEKVLTDIFESSGRLARLINIFLNVSRIEAGRFKMNMAPNDMNPMITSVITELKQQAALKNIELKVKLPKKSQIINVDSDKTREVVLNLIDNAIKYTKGGKIEITGAIEGDQYHFVCKDTGMGIRPDEVNGLFRKFVRGTGVAQVNTQGSGLGLYIAQRVIKEHGGKIWAESLGLDKGSTFQFTIPITKQPANIISEHLE